MCSGDCKNVCSGENGSTVLEPVCVLQNPDHPGARPDILLSGFDNGKDMLVDFTTASVLTNENKSHTWKEFGYAAQKAVQKKHDKYNGLYDAG